MHRVISTRTSSILAFVAAAILAALAPLAVRPLAQPAGADAFPGWPASYDGRQLAVLPMTEREAVFARDFPGRIGRFTDGEREIVLRWVAAPTRKLHPSVDCFKALGYRIATRPMRHSAGGQPMSCFRAEGRGGDALDVCEQMTRVRSGAGTDAARSWPDVSSWYWHALWSDRGDTWWSVVVAAPVAQ